MGIWLILVSIVLIIGLILLPNRRNEIGDITKADARYRNISFVVLSLNVIFLLDALDIIDVPWWGIALAFFASIAVAIVALVHLFFPSTLPRD